MGSTDKVLNTKPVPAELISSPNPAEPDPANQTDCGCGMNSIGAWGWICHKRSILRTSAGDQRDKGQNTCYYVIRTLANSKDYISPWEVWCFLFLWLYKACLMPIGVLSCFLIYIIGSYKNHKLSLKILQWTTKQHTKWDWCLKSHYSLMKNSK